MIRRKRKIGLRIALTILLLLILAVTIFVIIKREAVMLALNPKDIILHDRQTVRGAVDAGPYKILEDAGELPPGSAGRSVLRYQTEDEAFVFDVQFDEERVSRVRAEADIYKAAPVGIDEGISMAEELLSPYLSKTEMEAVELVLMSDILDITSRTVINYTRDIGDMTITVTGSLDKNDLSFILEQK